MTLLERISRHPGERTALSWPGGRLDYAALRLQIEQAMRWLSQQAGGVVGLDLDNGPDWVVLDIAAMSLGVCVVPLPRFFSAVQLRHAVTQAGIGCIVSDRPDRLRAHIGDLLCDADQPAGCGLRTASLLHTTPVAQRTAASIPQGVCKVTFTSGTTGNPKGVLLTWPQIRAVVTSLAAATQLSDRDRHLALMPLAVLLENIGGVYAPFWAGATVVVAPMRDLGVRGAVGIDGTDLGNALVSSAASTAIFTPQTLQALVEALESGDAARPLLRFVAVGGAPVSARLLDRAAALRIPVYEGYGLSECGSVVCLNTPGRSRLGSVGRPLPHVDLHIASDGEVLIRDSGFRGYLGEPAVTAPVWRTGDLGSLDADGYLFLRGRRRNVFINASGRNIAPEWVEREITLEEQIRQVAVFGEARPFNVAVVAPACAVTHAEVAAAISRTNRTLPDYARVARFIVADEPFSPANGMLTGTGRIRRDRVWERYRDALESLYLEAQTS